MKKLLILLVLVLCSATFGASEIRKYYDPNASLSVKIVDKSTNYIWNTDTSAFAQTVVDANIGIDLTEQSAYNNKGLYLANLPAGINTAKSLEFVFYDSNEAVFDSNNPSIGGFDFYWTGTTEITLAYLQTTVGDVNTVIRADITGLNDVSVADVNTQCQNALAYYGASTLIASDNIGINWADVSNPTTTVGLTNTTVGTVTTLTGHTAQTGDSYAIVNNGTYGNSAMKTLIDDVNSNLDADIAALNNSTVEEIRAEIDANSTKLAAIYSNTTAFLDANEPNGLADTIPEMIQQSWAWRYGRIDANSTQIRTYRIDDPNSIKTRQQVSVNGSLRTVWPAEPNVP